MTTGQMILDGQAYDMDLGETKFFPVLGRDNRGRPMLVLTWARKTQMRQVYHLCVVTLRLGLPPIQMISCYLFDNGDDL